MSHQRCCVVNCKNKGTNSPYKFYSFPTASWKLDQRHKWIAAVKRKCLDGTPWSPKSHDTICGEHFIGGKKSDEIASPSYVPTIFPKIFRTKNVNNSQVLARYTRVMKRSTTKLTNTAVSETRVIELKRIKQTQPVLVDQECQVSLIPELNVKVSTFTCNRFIYNDHSDAQIQVEIATTSRIIMPKIKK